MKSLNNSKPAQAPKKLELELEEYEIAISVVTYETDPNDLSALLRSLQGTGLKILITVVDNSATPVLRSTAEAGHAEYLFMGRNLGFGAGHNVAIRRSIERTKYHAVVNPDVVLAEGTLATLYHFMESHLEVGQAMPAVFYPDGREQRLAKRLPKPTDLFLRRFLGNFGKRWAKKAWELYETRDIDLHVARVIPSLSGCFMFLRSSVLREVGLFDERYFMYMEDIDLCRRVGSVSLTVICPEARISHGYSKGSYRNLHLLWYHLNSAFRYFSKWGWIWDRMRQQQNRRTGKLLER